MFIDDSRYTVHECPQSFKPLRCVLFDILLDIFDIEAHTQVMRTAEHSARELGTRSSRAKLPIQARPYFTHIRDGLSLGYRRGKNSGSWTARAFSEQGYRYSALGKANDLLESVGMSFQQAQDAARGWYEQIAHMDAGDLTPGKYTVADAMKDYLARFTGNENSKKEAERTIRVHVLPTLGTIEISKLKRAKIETWLHDTANAPRWNRTSKKPVDIRSRRASANRIFNTLRAALNCAYKAERVVSTLAWEKVETFDNVDVPKRQYFTAEQAAKFIAACPEDFRQLVRGALYTGCRYNELTDMTVEAFDANAGHVSVLQGKTGRMKHAHLTDDEIEFFKVLTKDKQTTDLVFVRSDGLKWGKSHQQHRMEEACKTAKVPIISFRALRTTFATLLAMNGTSIALIADQLGHAGQTVAAKHYAHYAPSHVATTIRANKPSFAAA
jgi:integrase